VDADYYRNRTGNQLVGYALPVVTGFQSIQYNLPAVLQNSGYEFEVSTINFKKKDFSWSTTFNISFPKNKLVSYPNIEGSGYANTYQVGKSIFDIKRLKYTGVDAISGQFLFLDVNKCALPQKLAIEG
jgi:hypothetical protein